MHHGAVCNSVHLELWSSGSLKTGNFPDALLTTTDATGTNYVEWTSIPWASGTITTHFSGLQMLYACRCEAFCVSCLYLQTSFVIRVINYFRGPSFSTCCDYQSFALSIINLSMIPLLYQFFHTRKHLLDVRHKLTLLITFTAFHCMQFAKQVGLFEI